MKERSLNASNHHEPGSWDLASPRMTWRLPAAIIVVAIVVRAIWGVAVPVVPVSDSFAYHTFATHIAAGGVYGWDGKTPSAYWPVGTAFLYSQVYRIWDPETVGFGGAVALNLVAGVAVVIMGMMLAARWFGRTPGLIAGALLALWPMHIQFTTVIASEMYFTAFCLGGILAWPGDWSPMRRAWIGRLLLAGLLFAAAAYIRPTALLVPAVLAGAAVLRHAEIRRIWQSGIKWGVVTSVMILVILPWAWRNHAAFDQFVLISTNGGANLWMGNNPDTDGAYQPIPERPDGVNEAEFNRVLSSEATAYIRARPAAFVGRTAIKAVRMHERETIGIAWNAEGLPRIASEPIIMGLKAATQAYWMLMLGLGIAGLGILTLRRGLWWVLTHPAVLIWGYFTAVHAVFVHQDRYHFPVTPMIAAIAAVALMSVYTWWMNRSSRTLQEPVV